MAARWLLCGLCLIPGWLLAACTAISSASIYPGDETVEAATAAAPDNAGLIPRFDRYLPFFRQEGESSALSGLVQQGDNWRMASVPYPDDADPGNSDYALTTDRLLVWRSVDGAGPGKSLLLRQDGEVVTLRIDNEPVQDHTDRPMQSSASPHLAN